MPVCPACAGESPGLKNRQRTADCSECYVETSDYFKGDPEAMNRNCSCHKVDHDKKLIGKFKPLKELKEYNKLIKKQEKEIEENKRKFEENKARYEQKKFEEEHPDK